jgi:hypothetical protein
VVRPGHRRDQQAGDGAGREQRRGGGRVGEAARAFTLHLQAGLGQCARRAGLSYLPMVVVCGLAGYHWRRPPAAARRVIVPAGLAVSAVAYLGIAVGLHRDVGGVGALT